MDTVPSPAFGDLLKRLRVAAGMTQEELAEAAQLSARAISDLERGIKRSPRRETVDLLARALNLTPAERATLEAASPRRGVALARVYASSGPRRDATVVPLVGRARETALIQRHLSEAGPPVLLLAGEPGIGKTSLLRHTATTARGDGWTVLEGGCSRRSGQEPYAPLLQAVERHLAGLSAAQRRAALLGCAWLVRLLPELAETSVVPAPAWALPAEQERRLMFAAVVRLLTNVASRAGTLLVLDDVQWAGPDALDMLTTLLDDSAQPNVRVIAAYRDTEAQPNDTLTTLLADLANAKLARQIQIGPLDAPEAMALLRGLLGDAEAARPGLAEHMLARCGGVPFYLVSCAQAVRAGTSVDDAAGGVPWDIAQGLQQRIAALPRDARDLLNVAAVVGQSIPRALLVAIATSAGMEEHQALDALEAAGRARLLVEERGDGYAFAHDLIREVVAARLGAARRASLHRQIAEALERQGTSAHVEQLAYHFAQAGKHEKAILYLEQVGDRARSLCAYGEAESAYRELAALLEQQGDEVRAAGVRQKLGTMLRGLARYDDALAALEQARHTYAQAGELEALGRTVAQIGRVYAFAGRPEEGLARLQPLPEPLSTSLLSQGTMAELHLALAKLCMVGGRYDEQLLAAERAAMLARAVGDDKLLAQAEMRRGDALQALGRTEEAAQALEGAIPLAEAAGEQMSLCFALNDLAVAYRARGDFESDHQYTQRALEVAARFGDPTLIAFVRHRLGINAWCRGDWPAAHADLEQSLALSEQVGFSWAAAYPPLGMGMLLLSAGEAEQALQQLATARALGERTGDIQVLRWEAVTLAEHELLRGEAEAALHRLSPLLDRPGQHEALVTVLLPFVAWAHLELGDDETAATMAEQARQRAVRQRVRPALVDALRVAALVAARQGRFAEARAKLAEALGQARTMVYPACEARALYFAGLSASLAGEPAQAREHYEAALAIFGQLGEQLYRPYVEAALGTALAR